MISLTWFLRLLIPVESSVILGMTYRSSSADGAVFAMNTIGYFARASKDFRIRRAKFCTASQSVPVYTMKRNQVYKSYAFCVDCVKLGIFVGR